MSMLLSSEADLSDPAFSGQPTSLLLHISQLCLHAVNHKRRGSSTQAELIILRKNLAPCSAVTHRKENAESCVQDMVRIV